MSTSTVLFFFVEITLSKKSNHIYDNKGKYDVFTNISSIREALKQTVQYCDQNSTLISVISTNDRICNQDLDRIDQSSMYIQKLQEILLTIEFEGKKIKQFIN